MSNLLFDAETHTYTLDGVVLPSVTQILKRVGVIDTRHYTTEARDRGSKVAALTAWWDTGRFGSSGDMHLVDVPDELRGYLKAWMRFLEDTAFDVSAVEHRVHNPVYRYAGTLDRTGWLNGRSTLIDIKTGGPEPWHKLQTAAYARCLYPEQGQLGCVYLAAEGTYKWQSHDLDRQTDEQAFLGAVNVFHWLTNQGDKDARTSGHDTDRPAHDLAC